MVVHAVYDLVVGYQIRRTARRYDQERTEPGPEAA